MALFILTSFLEESETYPGQQILIENFYQGRTFFDTRFHCHCTYSHKAVIHLYFYTQIYSNIL